MWSPRRIVLLAASFVLLLAGYMAYGFSPVGRIDGLPPLPEIYWRNGGKAGVPQPVLRETELEKRLKLAFGPKCEELGRPIRLDIRARGMVLSADDFSITQGADGRVVLSPMSIAMFGKDANAQDITTVRANVGYIKFDRPVTTLSEIGNRKMVALELSGRIEIRNNRRRVQNDQNLEINIPVGPLYYDEPKRKVWTHDNVQVVDHKAGPKPHVVKGRGMELELVVNSAGPNGKGRESITGVKWVELKSNVDMELHMAGQGGFFDASASPLGGAKGKTAASPPPPPAKRSQINIVTPGKFRYEMNKGFDLATFEAPPRNVRAGSPSQVHVDRQTVPPSGHDQLVCTRLVLRMLHNDPKAPASKTGPTRSGGEAARIESMHATGPEREVVISSESEKLSAYCADFFHNAEKGVTSLKGRLGMSVKKQDNEIHASDLTLTKRPAPAAAPGQPQARDSHDVKSHGPGRLVFKEGKDGKPMNASWTNVLTMTRSGKEDLVTLIGDARFDDPTSQQSLAADILKVWLDPDEKKSTPAPATAGGKSPSGSGRKPRHLEATGSVVVRSKDLNVHDTSRLVLWFRDVPPSRVVTMPAKASRPAAPAPKASKQPTASGMAPLSPVPGPRVAASTSQAKPYDVSARSIEARILRSPVKNSIDVLTCEGAVAVRQDPAKPTEKGTDIRGETLRMTAAPENCHILVVTGDMAELQTDKILILGPEVTINQYTNMAWVVGDGAMQMESATNFQGDKLNAPVPLTVHWKKSMVFNGTSAEFLGNIQADQGHARVACQRMETHFDRPVSLREGNRADQPARVKRLVCDKQVRVEETAYKDKQIDKYQRLEAIYVLMYALEADEPVGARPASGKTSAGNKVVASGPGTFRVIDRGSESPLGETAPGPGKTTPRTSAKPKNKGKKTEGDPLRMTHVRFNARMDADSKSGIVTFWKDVRVLHIPVKSFNEDLDMDRVLAAELPEQGMFMQCHKLKVLDRPVNGKPNKRMEGSGNVRVLGRDFRGSSDKVFYDQSKDQIIFEGGPGGPAELMHVEVPGAKPRTLSGKTIIYNRSTRKIKVEGGAGMSGASSQ